MSYDSPALDLTVKELTANLEKTANSLYQLQTFIINRDGAKSKATAGVFTDLRKNLRAQWENLRIYLQRCQAFGADVFTLEESLETAEPEDMKEFLGEMTESAKELIGHSRELKHTYESMEFPIFGILQMSAYGSNGASTTVVRPEVQDADLQAFIDANLAAAHPDGDKSFSEFKSALLGIDTNLASFHEFWNITWQRCQSYSGGISKPEADKVHADWTRYQKAVENAIVSITLTSDMILVEAVGIPFFERAISSAGEPQDEKGVSEGVEQKPTVATSEPTTDSKLPVDKAEPEDAKGISRGDEVPKVATVTSQDEETLVKSIGALSIDKKTQQGTHGRFGLGMIINWLRWWKK